MHVLWIKFSVLWDTTSIIAKTVYIDLNQRIIIEDLSDRVSFLTASFVFLYSSVWNP